MRSLWRYRRFIWTAALNDLRHRYAGSGLGVFWNVATPLAMMTIYTFVFSTALAPRFGAAGVTPGSFPLYLSAGFLPWVAFVDCVTRGTQSLVANSVYLKKLPIPEQVFVAQTAVSAVLGMLISVGLLIGLALVFGQSPQWTWLLLPVVVVLWQGFGFGLALALSTLNVFFRDVGQVLSVLLQIWMWSVPIVYLEDMLPQGYRAGLSFNPAYPFVRALRDAYLYAELPPPWMWGAMLGWGLVTVSVGWMLLGRFRTEIRDAL